MVFDGDATVGQGRLIVVLQTFLPLASFCKKNYSSDRLLLCRKVFPQARGFVTSVLFAPFETHDSPLKGDIVKQPKVLRLSLPTPCRGPF